METTVKIKADTKTGFEQPIHCTQYLVDGELKTWEGGRSDVYWVRFQIWKQTLL